MTVPLITFLDKADFAEQISAAVRRVAPSFGLAERPTDFFVTAHAAISTGWGKRGARGYNVTGMKAGSAWSGPTFQTPAFECVNVGTTGSYSDEENCPGMARVDITATWKQFASFDEWAAEYFRTVMRPTFSSSWAKLAAGSEDYMRQLGLNGWYTAPANLVSDMWKSILRTLASMKIRDLNLLAAGSRAPEIATTSVGKVLAIAALASGIGAATGLAVSLLAERRR